MSGHYLFSLPFSTQVHRKNINPIRQDKNLYQSIQMAPPLHFVQVK